LPTQEAQVGALAVERVVVERVAEQAEVREAEQVVLEWSQL
jgi:hypothetical protein